MANVAIVEEFSIAEHRQSPALANSGSRGFTLEVEREPPGFLCSTSLNSDARCGFELEHYASHLRRLESCSGLSCCFRDNYS